MNDQQTAKTINKLIDECVNVIHEREACKEALKGIEEVAVEKHGDEAKGVVALAEAVYKATYKTEAYEKARERKEKEFTVVDNRKA